MDVAAPRQLSARLAAHHACPLVLKNTRRGYPKSPIRAGREIEGRAEDISKHVWARRFSPYTLDSL